jgi:hypothetical protein
VEWSNLPAVLPETLVTLRGQVVMLRALGLPIPVDVVPSAEKLRPYLSVSTLGTWLDGDGWHARSVGPFPGAAMLGGQQSMVMVGVPVVTGAILLPSLGRAKVLANRSVDAAALSGIAKASVLYSVEHKDEAPPHLARLVAMQLIGPKQLVSRFSKTTPAVFTPEQLEAAFGDWTLIRDELDKHCDFIYVGAGSMAAVDSRSVIAYTKPGLDREGVNVAFEDGHVEYAKFGKRLQDMVAETNKLRAERKLQPIAIERPKAVGAQMAPAGPAR